MPNRYRLPLFVTGLLLACLASPTLAAGLEDRIGSVNNLLTISSAAKKIESSGSAEAMADLEKARALHAEARALLAGGDRDAASAKLNLAVKTVYSAVSKARPQEVSEAKHKADFENREKSIRALLEAEERIAVEKGREAQAASLRVRVDAMLDEALGLHREKAYVKGRAVLDNAYQLLKVAIEGMRGGEVLENRLVFATRKDEYDYYVAKVNSQLEAIGLLSRQLASEGKRRMAAKLSDDARKMMDEAATHAASGDHDAAVPLMEKALSRLSSGLMMVAN